ncbi:tetratricopeptide repeat-containing sensor histidine kinase [Saprospira sp. CCB-QB6]|uniref:tetratricopeptide repeat-containing sensor histidine kinase n=1 Tax=Saprospira sp. CCB-QB6 TaxID=3023936 RepID=UPI0023495B7C|nr:tetratricopeptide repeat-containing sensor histidine kinase [Saprospira sp. CCB-QB6]WCL82832.1 tetratricopeptide repeat-containing sensor histidine kinase [Saprospira sp. CCB-QB6]
MRRLRYILYCCLWAAVSFGQDSLAWEQELERYLSEADALYRKDRRKAMDILKFVESKAEKLRDTVALARIYNNMGHSYRHWGYTYRAAELFTNSYILMKNSGEELAAGFALVDIGNLYYDLKKYEEAKPYYEGAIKIFDPKQEAGARGLETCYNNLALVAEQKGEYAIAERFFRKALASRAQFQDSFLLAHSYFYLSRLSLFQKKGKQAEQFARSSMAHRSGGQMRGRYDLEFLPIAQHYVLGEAFHLQGQLDSAEYHFWLSVELAEPYPQLSPYFLKSYYTLGQIFREKGEKDQAEKLWRAALQKSQTLSFFDEKEKLWKALISLYREEENYAAMAAAYEQLYDLVKRQTPGASESMLRFHAEWKNYNSQEKLARQELELAQEQKEQRIQLWILSIIFCLLMLLAVFVFLLYKKSLEVSQKNISLSEQNRTIASKQKIISENAEELRELNETKDLLFSVIAHDLRGPFNSLTGFSKLMQTYIQNNRWQELKTSFQILDESSQQAYWIFENLLGWIQGQTGKLEAENQDIDIRPIVEESLRLLSSMRLLKNLNIYQDYVSAYAKADPYMLRTVLRNLLTNAIKFSSEGGNIYIRSWEEKNLLYIEVEDEGEGMSKEAIHKLFHTKKLQTKSQSVSGLGLILAKQFTECMQGQITIESQEQKGSIFRISLPIGEQAQVPVPESISPKIQPAIAPSPPSDTESFMQQHLNQLQLCLAPYLKELEILTVYEASALRKILEQLQEKPENELALQQWCNLLQQAIYNSDQPLYEQLTIPLYAL